MRKLELKAVLDKQTVVFEIEPWTKRPKRLSIHGTHDFQDCYEVAIHDLPKLLDFLITCQAEALRKAQA